MCNAEGPPLKKRRPQPLAQSEPLPIYLDYNATTPLGQVAWEAMCAVHNVWGNPSSTHPYGLAAKYALDKARQQVADALNAPSADAIVFTSGGTESNNLAIVGGYTAVHKADSPRNVIVSTNVEHPAVEKVLEYMGRGSAQTRLVDVDPQKGTVSPAQLESALRVAGPEKIAVVSIMFANNEIGAVNAIAELVDVVKRVCGPHCLFHTDAAQALGKVEVDVTKLNVDLLSVCGHKFYAPKGSGALYIKPGVRISNITFGAGHEKGIRPGTENVLLATGMAAALVDVCSHLEENAAHMRAMRDTLRAELERELHKLNMDLTINGDITVALPNTLNCALFKNVPDTRNKLPVTYISAARLILTIGDKVCISAGSACHATSGDEAIEVSAPLKAVGVTLTRAIGTLRISTGQRTTLSEVRQAARVIARAAAQQFAE